VVNETGWYGHDQSANLLIPADVRVTRERTINLTKIATTQPSNLMATLGPRN
jgi:hypothetical protein